MGYRKPQLGSLPTEDMYRGRGYPQKMHDQHVQLHAYVSTLACTSSQRINISAGYVRVEVHAIPDHLTRHDLYTQLHVILE